MSLQTFARWMSESATKRMGMSVVRVIGFGPSCPLVALRSAESTRPALDARELQQRVTHGLLA
jgi:hypothetical protein